jgi:hypothetical protein
MGARVTMPISLMSFVSIPTVVCAIGTLACVCYTGLAVAQDEPFRFELAPFAGYRVGGQFEEEDGDGEFELNESSTQGIILNIRASADTQWEVGYARQDTEIDTQALFASEPGIGLDVEYFHFGGTYLFEGENTRPFVAMTVGLSRFDPQPSDLGEESFPSVSIGGGVQLRSTERLGIRIEGRFYTTFVDSDSDFFCGSAGETNVCVIRVVGTTLTQWEVRAGLVFRF